MKKCKKYNECNSGIKENYGRWKDAFNNDNKAEIEKLMKGCM